MEPKRKEYIPEILGEISTGEKVVQKRKKRKSIAKMGIPEKNILIANRLTRFPIDMYFCL